MNVDEYHNHSQHNDITDHHYNSNASVNANARHRITDNEHDTLLISTTHCDVMSPVNQLIDAAAMPHDSRPFDVQDGSRHALDHLENAIQCNHSMQPKRGSIEYNILEHIAQNAHDRQSFVINSNEHGITSGQHGTHSLVEYIEQAISSDHNQNGSVDTNDAHWEQVRTGCHSPASVVAESSSIHYLGLYVS